VHGWRWFGGGGMSEQTTVRTDELRPGDRVWHPFDAVCCFTVAHEPKPAGLHFEGEPGLRVTGTDDRGDTVHIDVAPGYRWHRAPIRDAETAVRELGALPVPVGVKPPATQGQARTMLDRAREALTARMLKDDLRLVLENVITFATERQAENEQLRDDITGACLARWEEEQENKRLFLAWGSARMRARRKDEALKKLRARVAGLEAERHSTNESLSDAAEVLRRQVARITELEARLAEYERPADEDPIAFALTEQTAEHCDHPNGYGPNGCAGCGEFRPADDEDDVTPQVNKLRRILAGQREQVQGGDA
jgi:hypothetical protein